MLAGIGKSSVLCSVKTFIAVQDAAVQRLFLYPPILANNSLTIGGNEWGSSNAPKVSAMKYLTARIAAFFV